MYLTVSIPQEKKRPLNSGIEGVSVYDCFDDFFTDEHLDGDAWKCSRCKIARPATKKLSISKTPSILMIHLKRFSYQGPFRDKLDTFVDFPLRSNINLFSGYIFLLFLNYNFEYRELDLHEYMSKDDRESTSSMHRLGLAGDTVYDLYGVSVRPQN